MIIVVILIYLSCMQLNWIRCNSYQQMNIKIDNHLGMHNVIHHCDIKANKNLMYDFFLLFNSHPLLDYCDLKYYPGRFYSKVDLNRHKNCMLLSIAVISLIQFSFHIPLLLFLLILTFSAKNLTTAV